MRIPHMCYNCLNLRTDGNCKALNTLIEDDCFAYVDNPAVLLKTLNAIKNYSGRLNTKAPSVEREIALLKKKTDAQASVEATAAFYEDSNRGDKKGGSNEGGPRPKKSGKKTQWRWDEL